MALPSNDDLKAALVRVGYTGHINDATLTLLKDIYNLASNTSYNDALYYHLGQIPYSGSLSDRIAQWDGTTTVLEALGIINSRGTDAHAYIPGLGTINGLTAGNYLESTASTAATVDGLAGFVTDAYQGATLGAELVTNGNADNGTTGWSPTSATLSVVDGAFKVEGTVSTSRSNQNSIPTTAGKTYRISFTIWRDTSANPSVLIKNSSDQVTLGALGTPSTVPVNLQFYIVATGTAIDLWLRADAGIAYFDNISVREVPGIHATQATTANKPILRKGAVNLDGPYYGEFDSSNDHLNLGSVPFQMSDDHLTIICAKANAASGTLVSIGSSSSNTPRVAEISVDASGYAVASWIDDAATTATITGSTDLRGSVKVYRASKSGNNKTLHIDGVQIGSTESTAMGATTVNTARIGATAIATPSLFLNGNVYCRFDLKGAWTEAEAATLERFAGLFGGVTI